MELSKKLLALVVAGVLTVTLVVVLSVCLTGHCSSQSDPDCQLECDETGQAHWGYEEHDGPDCWGSCYATCAEGREQSPINVLQSVLEPVDFPPMQFTGYDQPHDMTLFNDGHSAKLRLAADEYTISGLGLAGEYIADTFHFHWGATDHAGSEHLMEGRAAPLEMHVIHYSSNYSSFDEAVGNDGGVAVLAFAFHVAFSENSYFTDVVDSLQDICYKDYEKVLPNQKLSDYLPAWYSGEYYRYRGSLTTPGCTEGLVWTLFADTIPLSEGQLQTFRSTLYAEEEQSDYKHIVDHNFRPTQPLNGRTVYVGSVLSDS